MEPNKIYKMDCLEGMKLIKDKSIDCVWTDVPYNINYHYDGYDDNLDQDYYYSLMEECIVQYKRIVKEGHSIFIKQFWKNLPMMLEIVKKHLNFHNLIIWKNPGPSQPKNNFKPMYEVILFLTNGPGPIYFNNKFETRIVGKTWDKSRQEKYFGMIGNIWDDIPFIYGGSIKHEEGCYMPGTNKKIHPAQHPIKLVKRCIGFVTKEKDIVLDPFIGSGTTAVACKQLNRRFIGFEVVQEYINLCNERLKQGNLLEILKC